MSEKKVCELKLGCDISLSKFSEFCCECLGWRFPPQALPWGSVKALTNLLHIAIRER